LCTTHERSISKIGPEVKKNLRFLRDPWTGATSGIGPPVRRGEKFITKNIFSIALVSEIAILNTIQANTFWLPKAGKRESKPTGVAP
jgi:hypothetical protein